MGSQKSETSAGATHAALRPLTRLSGIKRRRQRLIAAAAVVLVVGGGALIWSRGAGTGRRQLADYTATAKRGTLPGVITASGELEPIRRVNVSPKRQGLLDALYVDEGDAVTKGQVLARMDSGDFTDRMDELSALERQARADF